MELMARIKEEARQLDKTVVLPDSTDERTLRAAEVILREELAKVVLLGDSKSLRDKASALGLEIGKVEIEDPKTSKHRRDYIDELLEIRKHKNWNEEKAAQKLNDPLYWAVMMIKKGHADAEVAGSLSATGDVLKPAFQIVKTQEGISRVSGAFIMISENKAFGKDGVMIFADCAVNPTLTAREMAEVAVCSAHTAESLAGFKAKVAMLSFSTKGSAEHEEVDKVRKATEIAREMAPNFEIDGEIQADAALVEKVGKKKAPNSSVAGQANVLVFPDLNSANIGYKLAQRLGNVQAIGPVLQGLAGPINDLSRGCSVEDIVNTTAMACVQAAAK